MKRQFFRFQSTVAKHAITQQKFRESMGCIGNQAMILTSACDKSLPHDLFRGVTLSSVTSLSLKPYPLLQFNLQLPSFTSESLHANQHFAIHLLKPDAQSVKLARIFSKGAMKHHQSGKIVPTQPFKGLAESKQYETYQLGNSDLVIPLLKNTERIFVCKKKNVFKVGDHEIWVGQVEDIVVNEQNGTVTGGVLYCNRGFHVLGGKIE